MTGRGAEELTLAPLDNRALANLCGPLDANLRQIEAALDVAISHRGADFTIEGVPPQTAQAAEVLQRFYAGAEKPLSVDDIQLGLVEIATRGRERARPAPGEDGDALPALRTRRADLHGRTPNQIAYLKAIQAHDITCWFVLPSKPASGSDSCRAISRKRWIRICVRSTTRSMT